jgi:hypothetical protein
MGGGQSLNFGPRHLETFAWIGEFSSAPNTKRATELISATAEMAKQLKLLWISCGDKDGSSASPRASSLSQGQGRFPHLSGRFGR